MFVDISAVIPHYGDAGPTLELVEALKQQNTGANFEIIVSDDCSPVPFPETEGVIVTRRATNGGFGANVNNGVAQAQGEWLLILNSDLAVRQDFLERMFVAAKEQGRALMSPQVLDHDGTGQYVGRKFPTTVQHAWEWFTPVARFRDTGFWHRIVGHDMRCATGAIVEVDWVIGACMMVPTEIYRQTGGMDERFFMNSEEVDLQRRLAEQGIPRVFRGDIAVEHEGGGSSGASEQRLRWVLESRFIYATKWGNPERLKAALIGVSYMNYCYNRIREIRNPDVDSKNTKSTELRIIGESYRKVA